VGLAAFQSMDALALLRGRLPEHNVSTPFATAGQVGRRGPMGRPTMRGQ
jgi:hypothetical protein